MMEFKQGELDLLFNSLTDDQKSDFEARLTNEYGMNITQIIYVLLSTDRCIWCSKKYKLMDYPTRYNAKWVAHVAMTHGFELEDINNMLINNILEKYEKTTRS